jgi:hypothetical protein
MSSEAQKVNNDTAPQPPTRGGFVRIYRDDIARLSGHPNAALIFLWLQSHAAFTRQEIIRRGEVVALVPGECLFSLGGLEDALDLKPKAVRCAVDYLYKLDLIRIVTAKNFSKAIFQESISWGASAKYMCKILHKKDCTKKVATGGADQDGHEDASQGGHQGALSDEKNDEISSCCGESKDSGGAHKGADQGADQGAEPGATEGEVGAGFGPETSGQPGLPAPYNPKNAQNNLSQGAAPEADGSPLDHEEERDFYSQFEGKEKEIAAEYKKQFHEGVRGLEDSKDRMIAAIWMLYLARVKGKKIDAPTGFFKNLLSAQGEVGIPADGWSPFSQAVAASPPAREEVKDSMTPEERAAETRRRRKEMMTPLRSPAQPIED